MSTVNPAPTDNLRSTRQQLLKLLVTGILLGGISFFGDEISGLGASIVQALSSNGFAWGFSALLVGSGAQRLRAAAFPATGALVAATFVYYGLHLVLGQRWRLGVLADGQSASLVGLRSFAITVLFWLAACALAGPLFGVLGFAIRNGTALRASWAAGAAFGMLSAQGWYLLIFDRGWHTLDDYGLPMLISLTAIILLSAIGITLTVARRAGPKAWWLMGFSCVCSTIAGTLIWQQIDSLRVSL